MEQLTTTVLVMITTQATTVEIGALMLKNIEGLKLKNSNNYVPNQKAMDGTYKPSCLLLR